MADGLNVPICVLKVNIQCCEACPMKVKKRLQKINGVYGIDIDTKNGLVSVRGTVQPSILIHTISEKVGKKAQVYGYEKNLQLEIQNQNQKLLEHGNSCSPSRKYENKQTCDESNDHDQAAVVHNEPEEPHGTLLSLPHPKYGALKNKKHGSAAGWFGKKIKSSTTEPRQVLFGNFKGAAPGYARLLPPPPPSPPLTPPSYSNRYLPAVYDPYSPPFRITKPPRPYPYDFYEKKGPPLGNSAFHSFRDDNVNACTIM